MATIRFNALKETLNRKPVEITSNQRRSEIFAENVFNQSAMRQYLTKDSLKSVQQAIKKDRRSIVN